MAPSELARAVLAGDRRALARAITLAQDGGDGARELISAIYPHTGRSWVVGVTGAPGAGKSTLVGALVARRRAAGATVGVLSIDPSSPFTGGAVLGDRIRLTDHFLDPGVYIRSMASRGALGGLAAATLEAVLLMDAAGLGEIYVETVGVGQAEIDVVDHADAVLLVLSAGAGDSVQALKAGVMEIPDVIAVNKSDHPLAQTTLRDVRGVLALAPAGAPEIAVVLTDALDGDGVQELDEALRAHRERLAAGELEQRRRGNLRGELLTYATASWRSALEQRLAGDASFDQLLDEVAERRLDPLSAAERLIGQSGVERT